MKHRDLEIILAGTLMAYALSMRIRSQYHQQTQSQPAPTQPQILEGSGPVTLTDQGTVAQSFNFATNALDQSYGVLKNAADAYSNTRDALQNAYQQSLSFVGKTTTPADEASQQRSAWLMFGVLVVAGLMVYSGRKK